ncbi:MAG: PEP-CTERM sorting domain-containing protein [Verrucomicrobiota bacterium]|nr:PEP-CTERM sorting domain-containing protein [Verrucomicrobiota bacterium]
MNKTIVSILTISLLGITAAQAQIIVNVDFNSTNNGGGATFVGLAAATDPAGATALWNGISNDTFGGMPNLGATNLLDSTGAASGLGISVSDMGGGYSGSGNALLNDYLYINSGTNNQVVTISGLNNSASYDLFIYGMGDNGGQGSTFTIAGNSLQTSNNPRDGSVFVEGNNFVKFANLTPTAGGLTINWTLGPDGSNGALNGIQIVSSIPEPSTYAALAGIIILLVAIARRRK